MTLREASYPSLTVILDSWRDIPVHTGAPTMRSLKIKGHDMQASMARPLGTKRPRVNKADAARQKIVERAEETACTQIEDTIGSSVADIPPATIQETRTMTLTLKGISKSGTQALYGGAANALRIPVAAFPGKQPPSSFDVADGVFAPVKVKIVETKEERKARLAAAPKPTLADRVATAEKRAQALRDKLAKENAA